MYGTIYTVDCEAIMKHPDEVLITNNLLALLLSFYYRIKYLSIFNSIKKIK